MTAADVDPGELHTQRSGLPGGADQIRDIRAARPTPRAPVVDGVRARVAHRARASGSHPARRALHGALLIAALAACTLIRQGLLRLRAEPRRSKLGRPIIAAVAALTLIADVIVLVVVGA
ncbi:hypothetical protein ACFLIM_48275 [Nonomuraea sp. M3C6]|uniref:DUF202 domain-containing protein n=1 Tax=Nonomuraea marmarensis TaxID=3351344 RepID=A0ABW7AVC4_9ACTN